MRNCQLILRSPLSASSWHTWQKQGSWTYLRFPFYRKSQNPNSLAFSMLPCMTTSSAILRSCQEKEELNHEASCEELPSLDGGRRGTQERGNDTAMRQFIRQWHGRSAVAVSHLLHFSRQWVACQISMWQNWCDCLQFVKAPWRRVLITYFRYTSLHKETLQSLKKIAYGNSFLLNSFLGNNWETSMWIHKKLSVQFSISPLQQDDQICGMVFYPLFWHLPYPPALPVF